VSAAPTAIEAPARFLADAMLGRLARWLRVIGADTIQLPTDAPDVALVARAREDERVLLTRDRHLLRELRPHRELAIQSTVPLVQLGEVVHAFGIRRPAELLTRCLLDNTPLVEITPAEVVAQVPLNSRELTGPMRRCPTCGRAYWRGSHVRRMEAALESALPDWVNR
jgi:uncharacterized protein with PIN domain